MLVVASQQPDVDEGLSVRAVDADAVKTDDRSVILGTPNADTDEQSALLRRNLRTLLAAHAVPWVLDLHARALVVLGAATFSDEEKLSWALRGMDPTLYAGYDIVAVIADGVVKPLLLPARRALPGRLGALQGTRGGPLIGRLVLTFPSPSRPAQRLGRVAPTADG